MRRVKVELNYKGLLQLWKDPIIAKQCEDAAKAIEKRLGGDDGDYNVSAYTGKHRAGAALWVNSYKARRDNLENNSVLKALGGVIPAEKIVKK